MCRPEPNQNGTLSNGHGSNGHSSNGYITRGTGGLHEDADFPTNLKTLTRRKPVAWMRPHVKTMTFCFICLFTEIFLKQDMSTRPQFRVSPSGSVLTSRELPEPVGPGDPSLLAAIGCLSQFPNYLRESHLLINRSMR